jgi:hypothetical protein
MASALLARPTGAEQWLNAGTTAAAIVLVSLLCFVPLSANDFWLDAAIGRLILATGDIPRSALFPFTEARDFPFHAHEWLSQVLLSLLDSGLGHERLIFVKGLLGLALFGLAYRLSRRLTGSFGGALLIALAVMIVANFRFRLRPELFALLFTALMLNLLVEYRLRGRRRYLLACLPLAAAWANMHGSAPLAVALAAAFAAGAAWEAGWRGAAPYALCALFVALAELLNPYGASVFSFAWQLENAAYLRSYVYEWMPTLSGPFVGTGGFWAFMLYLPVLAAVLFAGRKRLSAAALLLLVAFGALALSAERHIALFAVVSLYPLSLAAAALTSRLDASRRLRAGVLLAIVGAVGLALRYGNLSGGFPYFVESNNFSLLLAGYVDAGGVRGNVLNSYALGAELVYRAYPRARPAIDSRMDVYGEDYFLYIERALHDESAFREFVRRYDVHYVLVTWPDFDAGLRHMPDLRGAGWHIAFADHKAVLLARP